MPGVIATQDATLIDSLGPIANRENEHLLPLGDYGAVALRRPSSRVATPKGHAAPKPG